MHTGAALRVHADERFRLTGKRDLTDLRYAAVARELRDERGRYIKDKKRKKQLLAQRALAAIELFRSALTK